LVAENRSTELLTNKGPVVEFKVERENVSFWLKVKPRSSRERLTADAAGELRLELHAAPVEGEANEACLRFLARSLRLPQACVVILAGGKARRKLIRITGRSAEETIAQIKALAGSGSIRRAS
jgi:uncharacterized protein YggU (UPF0235/DUF167 family)